MTYSEFLQTLVSPITTFVSGLSSIASSLMSNYIFITLLGLVIFGSLFWLIYDTFVSLTINCIESPKPKKLNQESEIPSHTPEPQTADVSELRR